MWILWRVEGEIDVASLESGGRGRCGFSGEGRGWMWILWIVEGEVDVAFLDSGRRGRCGFSRERGWCGCGFYGE